MTTHTARPVHTVHPSPVGDLLLTGTVTPAGLTLTSLSLPGQRGAPVVRPEDRDDRPFAEALRQLDAYFAGRLTRFDLSFSPVGNAFRHAVWQALDEVPYGRTTTYGELTARLGLSRAEVRSVGQALGANPLLLVRPCHRVIGADGSLRGYAGGLEKKRWLLTHEGALQPTLL
ncbi:methylated-DNA--[protein]-cysteine S-methyltransferase [Streptomyces dangxiongensis]|uniref:methylated-DNA--[protein]-cysteine S-methyltransferase n=1 Tax=Streptomyces dangxiongensis TaxID=1442032 RepID=A0A3G2J9G2_9ACTN|nr:methylated-DNA--[protein]-cysteine S-methyltransferase [Streptomyces dangxiongensis]AYN38065.1 methylated-DNA--[protein]-cysteine S-methyltransferase [Streptomyces dangxiongensis]